MLPRVTADASQRRRKHRRHLLLAHDRCAHYVPLATADACFGWISVTLACLRAVDGVAALSFCGTWSNEHEALLASRTPGPPPYGEPCFDRKIFFTAATSMPADLPEEVRANGSAAHAKVVKLLDAATPGKVAHRVAKMATDVLLRKNATFTVRVTAAQVARARAAGASLTGASLSANDVALGLAWALLRRARKRGVDGPPRLGDDEHFLLQTIDLRRYLPGLPQAYFGNCAWALQVAAPVTARSPLELAAGCRASLASFTNSTAVFDQAALMLRATGGQSTSAQLRTTLLPAFGDGMVSSWHAPVIWNFTFGAGKPRWFCGSIYPVAPWCARGANASSDRHSCCDAVFYSRSAPPSARGSAGASVLWLAAPTPCRVARRPTTSCAAPAPPPQ